MPSTVRCCKPGCGAPAAARLTYDHAGATAWIDNAGGDGGWPLCPHHADTLRVPVGWDRIDRRHRGAPTVPLAS